MDIEIAGQKLPVVLPKRFSHRRLAAKMYAIDAEMGCIAALAMCVPDLEVKVRLEGVNYSIGEYASRSWDELNARGYDDEILCKAAQPIVRALLESVHPSDEEVDAEVGFTSTTDPTEEERTSQPSSTPTSGDSPTPSGSPD